LWIQKGSAKNIRETEGLFWISKSHTGQKSCIRIIFLWNILAVDLDSFITLSYIGRSNEEDNIEIEQDHNTSRRNMQNGKLTNKYEFHVQDMLLI